MAPLPRFIAMSCKPGVQMTGCCQENGFKSVTVTPIPPLNYPNTVAYWKNATFNVNIAPSPISSPRAAYAAGLARFSIKQGFEYLRSVAKGSQ
jgi:hypothetical protein